MQAQPTPLGQAGKMLGLGMGIPGLMSQYQKAAEKKHTEASPGCVCFLLSHVWKLKCQGPLTSHPISCGVIKLQEPEQHTSLKVGSLPPTLLSHQASQAPYCCTGTAECIINRKAWKHLHVTKTLGIHTWKSFSNLRKPNSPSNQQSPSQPSGE